MGYLVVFLNDNKKSTIYLKKSLAPSKNGTLNTSRWKIFHMDAILQQDGHNCGPITCMVGWAAIDSYIKVDMVNMHIENYREIVINWCKQLLNNIKAY